MRLLVEINKEAERVQSTQEVLLEINVSGEEAKHGFMPNEMESVLEECAGLSFLRVRGLESAGMAGVYALRKDGHGLAQSPPRIP